MIRDFPFGIEATAKEAINALTFVDLVGPHGGLLVIHGGTQYFKRSEGVVFANLAIRDFPLGPGWPRAADYRYALMPHGNDFTNADRLRAVAAFDSLLFCRSETLHAGRLDKRHGFAFVDTKDVLLSAFRRVGQDAYELRVVEQNSRPARARLKLQLSGKGLTRFAPCDLLGRTSAEYRPLDEGGISVSLAPWQIKTFRVE